MCHTHPSHTNTLLTYGKHISEWKLGENKKHSFMKLPPALCYYISRPALNTPHTVALAEESSASKSTLAHSKSWNNNYIQQNATQLFIFSLFMNVATLESWVCLKEGCAKTPIVFIIILPTRKRSLPENGVHNGICIVHQHCVFFCNGNKIRCSDNT